MKWSWKITRIAGMDVYIHATFLLLIAWIAISYYITQRSLVATINGVIFILALFLCVFLHELGHALMARKYNVPTKDITLLPIGGVARLDRMPEDPKEELWISLAGPGVNLIIAIMLLFWIMVTNSLGSLNQINLTSGSFLGRLMLANAWLALFNLIPAFPMDGGRILRALLGIRLEYTRATQIAAVLGQGIALIFGLIGLFTNPFLLFIAFFVWIGAAQESSLVQMKSAISGIPVSSAMMTQFMTLSPRDSLGRVVELILSSSQHDFPVVDEGKVVGILTRQDLISGLSKRGNNGSVENAMCTEFTVIDSTQMLEQVSECLQTAKCRTIPVMSHGELVGLLTMDNLGELLMIRTALKSDRVQPILPAKPFTRE